MSEIADESLAVTLQSIGLVDAHERWGLLPSYEPIKSTVIKNVIIGT